MAKKPDFQEYDYLYLVEWYMHSTQIRWYQQAADHHDELCQEDIY